MKTLAEHEHWFQEYAAQVASREQGDKFPLRLKVAHTFGVLRRARRIAASELLEPPLVRAVELAALYHDVARFEQYLHWHTFKDALSTDHGTYGAELLEQLGCLDEEDAAVRSQVIRAVFLHNKYSLPADLPGDFRIVTCITRDSDKLDILRVIDEYLAGTGKKEPTVLLSVADEPDKFTPLIAETALARGVAQYGDLRYVNDFRMLLGTWVYDLNFAESRSLMASEGHIQRILAGLPPDTLVQRTKESLLADISACAAGQKLPWKEKSPA